MPEIRIAEGIPLLRAPREGEDIVADYSHTGLTLRRYDLSDILRTLLWVNPTMALAVENLALHHSRLGGGGLNQGQGHEHGAGQHQRAPAGKYGKHQCPPLDMNT